VPLYNAAKCGDEVDRVDTTVEVGSECEEVFVSVEGEVAE
jgi:hypothetical protein